MEKGIAKEAAEENDSQMNEPHGVGGKVNEPRGFYTKDAIQNKSSRESIQAKLSGKLWQVVVVALPTKDGSWGFVAHPKFVENIYFDKINTEMDSGVALHVGDTLEVEIMVAKDKKKDGHGYAVRTGRLVKRSDQAIPNWWRAWKFWGPRLSMMAQGKLHIAASSFKRLEAEGFDVARIRAWQPNQKDGRRIDQVNFLVQKVLSSLPANDTTNLRRIEEQLQGDRIWTDLRHMVQAYLNGMQVFATAIGRSRTPVFNPRIRQGMDKQHTKERQVLAKLHARKIGNHTAQDIGDFIGMQTELTLYIDEVWPVEGSVLSQNEGVIAGVLCHGREIELPGLPKIETHAYQHTSIAKASLRNLLQNKHCCPLVLSLKLPNEDELAIRHYDTLLKYTIQLVCGWLLPCTGQTISLSVILEAIGPDHTVGTEMTEYFRGLLDGKRFSHVFIETVRWDEKNAGYIPYADLIGHYTLAHTSTSREIGDWIDYKRLPGYVPFSLELVPRLERLEHLEHSTNMQDVIDMALEAGKSRFGKYVKADLMRRMIDQPYLQEKLLAQLENNYRDNVRDLSRLRVAYAAVREMLPKNMGLGRPEMRLLGYLLALQHANHDGDPMRIRNHAAAYATERRRLIQMDRELCAYTDLNLAVHYADQFQFGHAEVVVRDWIDDPLFPALSMLNQAKMHSALGQYRAMQGDAAEAERHFVKALTLFATAPVSSAEQAANIQKTSIYRAFNALDGNLAATPQILQGALGPINAETAAKMASDHSVENQFQHHLLVRALLQRRDLAEAKAAYIAAREHWEIGHWQHPWPSIQGVRGLLLFQTEDESAAINNVSADCFDLAIELAGHADHGPTVKLIGAMWASVAACCFEIDGFQRNGRRLLGGAAKLSGAGPAAEVLGEILESPDPHKIDTALGVLPFNYR